MSQIPSIIVSAAKLLAIPESSLLINNFMKLPHMKNCDQHWVSQDLVKTVRTPNAVYANLYRSGILGLKGIVLRVGQRRAYRRFPIAGTMKHEGQTLLILGDQLDDNDFAISTIAGGVNFSAEAIADEIELYFESRREIAAEAASA